MVEPQRSAFTPSNKTDESRTSGWLMYVIFFAKHVLDYHFYKNCILGMIRRQIKDFLLKSASQYPVVLVHGPRQSGKNTLCRDTFANKPYISLENPDTRERALQDPRGFFKSIPNGKDLDSL